MFDKIVLKDAQVVMKIKFTPRQNMLVYNLFMNHFSICLECGLPKPCALWDKPCGGYRLRTLSPCPSFPSTKSKSTYQCPDCCFCLKFSKNPLVSPGNRVRAFPA